MDKQTTFVTTTNKVDDMVNTNKTEYQEALETVVAIQAIKFGMVDYGSVLYWHYLTIITRGNR